MILYKYMSNRSFLSNLMVRFTPPNELNDPRELAPRIHIKNPDQYADAIIARNFQPGYIRLLLENPTMTEAEALSRCRAASKQIFQKYRSNDEDISKMMFDIVTRTTNENIGIFSLTETNNNELMWAHYANSHTGFAVGFDTETNFFSRRSNDPKLCGELTNVFYSDKAPTVYFEPGVMEIPKNLFFTKTTKWSYEREWRLIRMLSAADSVVDNKIHLFKVDPPSVVSIIFGQKFPEAEKESIKNELIKIAPNVSFANAGFNHKGEFVVS
ncbi:DUF2971 domain-containing protein [Curvibacter lanceolatus]|uniref:DUF2971 domain-containing protein n=1 Tax=Curvibacter lanceolatus TaxID=86182 RepID=UPI0003AA3211|nr:DUF2971 domain-containing protein [Curvibacter lanceolatus]